MIRISDGLKFVFPRLLSGSLSAMRFVAAVQEKEKGDDKLVEQLSRELWRRIWSEDKDITEAASLSEVPARLYLERLLSSFEPSRNHFFCVWSQAAKKAGLSDSEIKEALEMAVSKEIKDKLKGTTQKALEYGVSRPPNVVALFLKDEQFRT